MRREIGSGTRNSAGFLEAAGQPDPTPGRPPRLIGRQPQMPRSALLLQRSRVGLGTALSSSFRQNRGVSRSRPGPSAAKDQLDTPTAAATDDTPGMRSRHACGRSNSRGSDVTRTQGKQHPNDLTSAAAARSSMERCCSEMLQTAIAKQRIRALGRPRNDTQALRKKSSATKKTSNDSYQHPRRHPVRPCRSTICLARTPAATTAAHTLLHGNPSSINTK